MMDTVLMTTLSNAETNSHIKAFVDLCNKFAKDYRKLNGRRWVNLFARNKDNVLLYMNNVTKIDQTHCEYTAHYVQPAWWTDPIEIVVCHNKSKLKFNIIL